MSKQAKTSAVYNIISSHMANKENKKIELADLPKKVLQIIAAKYKKILKKYYYFCYVLRLF